MLIMRTPKGWTGPKFVDGKPVEGTWRAHQVPLSEIFEKPEHLHMLDEWMRSYKPEELFDEKGGLSRGVGRDCAPKGRRRMGMNAHANGGLLLQPLKMPDFREFAVEDRGPRTEGRGIHARSGTIPSRSHGSQQGAEKLSRLRPPMRRAVTASRT